MHGCSRPSTSPRALRARVSIADVIAPVAEFEAIAEPLGACAADARKEVASSARVAPAAPARAACGQAAEAFAGALATGRSGPALQRVAPAPFTGLFAADAALLVPAADVASAAVLRGRPGGAPARVDAPLRCREDAMKLLFPELELDMSERRALHPICESPRVSGEGQLRALDTRRFSNGYPERSIVNLAYGDFNYNLNYNLVTKAVVKFPELTFNAKAVVKGTTHLTEQFGGLNTRGAWGVRGGGFGLGVGRGDGVGSFDEHPSGGT